MFIIHFSERLNRNDNQLNKNSVIHMHVHSLS